MNRETPFRFEHEMLRPVISRIPEMFHVTPGQRLRVLQETAIGSVVPDVLLGVWSGELPHWNGLNSISRHILAWLMVWKTANSEEQLQRDLFLSEHATTSAITALKRVGAITSRDSGEVALLPGLEVLDSVQLVAIEMKLKRWRDALQQAMDYRSFADEAYVVLDGNQVRLNDEITNAFVANGIGLFLQRNEELENVVTAIPSTPRPSVDRLFALTKLANSGPYCLA